MDVFKQYVKKKTILKYSHKIILLTSEFPPIYGGISSHAHNLYKAISSESSDVVIIAPGNKSGFDRKMIFKGDEALFYNDKSYLKLFTILNHLFKLLIKNPKSVVIASGQFPVIIFGIFFNYFCIKSVAILHGHEAMMGSFMRKKLFEKSIKSYSRIIAVSSFSKQNIKRYISSLNISVINNGIDLNRFKSFPRKKVKKDNPRMLTIGSLTERKGQKNVINALPKLIKRFDDVCYQMVGAPVLSNEITLLAKSYGVIEKIKIHSTLPDKLMVDIIYDSNIFIMLSNNLVSGDVEGFGIAILEANYFGLPAIGSKNCGIEDAICDKITGRLVDPKSSYEILMAVEDIMNNYDQYSQEAKKWAISHDWKIKSKSYKKIISEL